MATKKKQDLSFEVSKSDLKIIYDIVIRAQKQFKRDKLPFISKVDLMMDLTACHASGTPLRLRELLAAGNADFWHDVLGINRHLNRETGALGDCFSPRFSKRKGG